MRPRSDGLFGWAGGWFGQAWSLSGAFAWVFSPIAWVMGIEAKDCPAAGQLLGVKMAANEFVAYAQLSVWMKAGSAINLSERSIAIQIGGIGGMAPNRRGDLARLGLRAMLGGALANFMTACVAGVLL